MAHLTEQELSFFNQLFENADDGSDEVTNTKMSVKLNLPDKLNGLLKNAKLTLLAEVGVYQLWFPLEFVNDENGQVIPLLSAPEVIDTKGIERSWRAPHLNLQTDHYIILSLSSTGVLLKPKQNKPDFSKELLLAFELPKKERIVLSAKPVRVTSNGIAAKIITVHEGEIALRQYLFDTHKKQHAQLYEHANISTDLI
ncbi:MULTISPECIES: hypothetical protein [unclassified Pseudoalteromonas]|uniref:hypothetical protein n=1 Tax=unclassified Pseudoalteromonas TaxID=194690 RepID=UPI001107FDAB|nr:MULTISPECIES: hypothetical protein [unclassified Pseudoalteromonas]MCO7251291.1 hypothetical protein [Pseudoalteromonas sp. Ps84H-4]TMO45048.1 hypothetical protein CWC25_07175 [Pseudoalteromonas sp. S4389]